MCSWSNCGRGPPSEKRTISFSSPFIHSIAGGALLHFHQAAHPQSDPGGIICGISAAEWWHPDKKRKRKKKVNKTWRAHSCGSVPTQVCHSLCMLCGSRRGRCDVVLQQYTAFFSADPRNDTATHERASPHDKTLVSVPDHVLDERGQPHHVRHSSADDQREKIPSEGVRMLFRLTARVFQPLSPTGMNEDLELGHAPPGAIPEAFAMGRRPRSLPSPMAFRSDRTHMRCAELMEELLY